MKKLDPSVVVSIITGELKRLREEEHIALKDIICVGMKVKTSCKLTHQTCVGKFISIDGNTSGTVVHIEGEDEFDVKWDGVQDVVIGYNILVKDDSWCIDDKSKDFSDDAKNSIKQTNSRIKELCMELLEKNES